MNKSRFPVRTPFRFRKDYGKIKTTCKLCAETACREVERRDGIGGCPDRGAVLGAGRGGHCGEQRQYGGYCYQIAFRILALREDAEECVGDTWLRAWEAMPPSRPGRLDTFLGKITRNLSLDRWRALRAQKRWQGQAELALTELGDCLPASGGVEQEVEAAALAESLNRFLESLPQEKRVLFVRRYWYLCSVEELAAWSGRRRGTVSAALFRLRQDLREHLEREGFTL